MGEDTVTGPLPSEYQPTAEDLELLEESRRLLQDPSFIPERVEPDSRPEFQFQDRSKITNLRDALAQHTAESRRAMMACNNFGMCLPGGKYYEHPISEPMDELQGRSQMDLKRDVDELIVEHNLNPAELRRLRTLESEPPNYYEPDAMFTYYQTTWPVFEGLVRDKGYPITELQG
jgi:hypothetical protein